MTAADVEHIQVALQFLIEQIEEEILAVPVCDDRVPPVREPARGDPLIDLPAVEVGGPGVPGVPAGARQGNTAFDTQIA
jgi:hypothetical protein